jgi:hypothetical protein
MREALLYICPRCGFVTNRKQVLDNHLNRKVRCQPEVADIELTESVKEKALSVKTDKKGKKGSKISMNNNNNNNNNNINNTYHYVLNVLNTNYSNMQLIDTFSKCKQISLTPFEKYLDEKFTEKADNMVDIELKLADFQDILGTVSSIQDVNFQDMNLFYDKSENTINIFDEEKWTASAVAHGMKNLIEKLQNCYFDKYECHLLNKIDTAIHADVKEHYRDLVKEYYRFLSVFDVKPFCQGQTDYYIITEESNQYAQRVAKEFTALYYSTKEKLKPAETKSMRKSTIEIIQRRSSKWLQLIKNILCQMASDASDESRVQQLITETIHSLSI